MNKKEWKAQLKSMEDMLETAKQNEKFAHNQVEELEFNVQNYKNKIKTFK